MPGANVDLVLYVRQGCHLCSEAERIVARAARRAGLNVRRVDVDTDAEAARRFGARVPVLLAGERELCAGRFDARSCEVLLGVASGPVTPWWSRWFGRA